MSEFIMTRRKMCSTVGIGLGVIKNVFHIIGYPLLNISNLSQGKVP